MDRRDRERANPVFICCISQAVNKLRQIMALKDHVALWFVVVGRKQADAGNGS